MAIEAKDIVGWGVTGGIGLLSLFLNWQTRRDTRRRDQRESASIWKLRRTRVATSPDAFMFEMSITEPEQNRIRINEITILKPRGAKIAAALVDRKTGRAAKNSQWVPGEFQRTLVVRRDMVSDQYFGPGGAYTANSSTLQFFVSDTANWWFLRRNVSRLVAAIDIESISSSAEETRLKIRSEKINWTASAASNAT